MKEVIKNAQEGDVLCHKYVTHDKGYKDDGVLYYEGMKWQHLVVISRSMLSEVGEPGAGRGHGYRLYFVWNALRSIGTG